MKLPKRHTELSRDDRRISAVYYDDASGSCFEVGGSRCAKIEAYDESGHMACIPWIAIIDADDFIVCRIPADKVSIFYAKKEAREMWITQPLQKKTVDGSPSGKWTYCAESDEGGGFVEGCVHDHFTAEDAQTCPEARRVIGQTTGFPDRTPKSQIAEAEKLEKRAAELRAKASSQTS
jgi:hypothetical protein